MESKPPENAKFLELPLLERIKIIAEELEFSFRETIDDKYENFIKANLTQGDRCVDDRAVCQLEGYPYADGEYTGMQIAGGTFGLIDCLRYVAKDSLNQELGEHEARNLIVKVYNEKDWKIGDHIDDDHGQMTDIDQLKTRKKGCGDQDKKRAGKVLMFRDIVTSEDIDGRFDWARENNYYLPVLEGGHHAKAALINLVADQTYDNEKAVEDNNHAFNCDLWVVEQRAEALFDALGNKVGNTSKEEFIAHMENAVLMNYFQTLRALEGPREIQIRQ